MANMKILCLGVCLNVLFGVNGVMTTKLEGKCLGSGSYYADGKKTGELKKSEDFTSAISNTVHIIGIKCCNPESSSIPESLGVSTGVNGSHSPSANWKCLPLLDEVQEPKDWTLDSFNDRSWPRAKEIAQGDTLANNSYAKLGSSEGIWLSTPMLPRCTGGKSCRPKCFLCRSRVAQDFHSNMTQGVIRYPGSDNPLEDLVYLASYDFIIDVMGCESATLTLKPCNGDSGNLVEVFFSAVNNIGSKIQLCENFRNGSTKCKTVATSLNATISCFHYKSFYVAFPTDGSLSVSQGVESGEPLMNLSEWQTDTCDHITSVVMSQREPAAKFSFYRSDVENRCLVTKDEVAQLEQCGDDLIDEELCLSCGCCWQAFVNEFSEEEVPYDTRCFHSFAISAQRPVECRHRSLKEIIGDIVFSVNEATAFSDDPVTFVVAVKNVFNGMKTSVQFGDGSTLDSLTLNLTELTLPVSGGSNKTGDYHQATFAHRYDAYGEKTAVLTITDSRKDPNNTEVVRVSVNFTVVLPDLIVLSRKPKVDMYEELEFVILTRNSSRNESPADVIFDDGETRYNLSFDGELALPSWVPPEYRDYQGIVIPSKVYTSAGAKEVTVRKVVRNESEIVHDESDAVDSDRVVARKSVNVRSLNETFARVPPLRALSDQPVAGKESVQYAFSLPKILNQTQIHVDFGDDSATIDFTLDDLSTVPDGVELVQNASQYTILFHHEYSSPGVKEPVVKMSLAEHPDAVFERRALTTVMLPVSNVSLVADTNVTDLYEDVTFVLSASNVKKRTRVVVDFGDGNKSSNVSLRRDFALPLWFQKLRRNSGLQFKHWTTFTHAFSSPGLKVVRANITDSVQRDSEPVIATVNVRIRSLEETIPKFLESLTVQIPVSKTNFSETPVLVRMKTQKVLKDSVLSVNFGDNSKTVAFNLTAGKDVPDIVNFSHVYNRTQMYQVKFSLTSKDRFVQVNKTQNITVTEHDGCRPEESIRLLGAVVIVTQSDDPIIEGDTVSFLVLTKRLLKKFRLTLSVGTATVNMNLQLDTKSRLPPSAKKFSSYFQATAKHTFCDHGSFWLRFTLFSCKNVSVENITKFMYTTVYSFKEFIGNPIIFPVEPSRALAHENVTFLVQLENVNNAAIMKLNFGDQQLLNLSVSARQTRLLRLVAEHGFSEKFKTVVNHSYVSESVYEVTIQVLSGNSECVIDAVESKTLMNIVPFSPDTIDMSVDSQSYQSLPVNEMIAFDVYTRKGLSDYVTQLDFGRGSNASLDAYPAPVISEADRYRKQSYQHKFLQPGLYTVAVNVAVEQQNGSRMIQAKRSRCVNVIAFDEAVGKVKIFALDEGPKRFLVGDGVQFVVLVKNSIHGMHVSVSYGEKSSQNDTITFQEWESSLPSWVLAYQKEQYHYGIANHVFTNAGTYRVTVNVGKDDLDFNVSFAVVESLYVTIHPKTSLTIIVAGGGVDISNAVKYSRQRQVLFTVSIQDYNEGDLEISWTAHRLKSMATGTQDTDVVFIPLDVDTTKTSLLIPPFSLNFGTYIFQIQLSQRENRGLLKAVGSNYTWITVIALPLQSVINMKKHYDGSMPWVELDGSGSNDPNENRSQLTYEWYCAQGGHGYLPQIGDSLCNDTSRCVRSCLNLPPGSHHQSCLGCDFYATCYNETLYDFRPCPAKSHWDDIKKRCSTSSATCICKEPVTGCFRDPKHRVTGPVIKFTARDFKFSRSQVDYFFDLVVSSRLGVLGKSDAVKVSVVSQHFHDSLPPPPTLSIICKSNCNRVVQQYYPLILTFQCLHCQLSEDDTLSSSWKVTGNLAKADLNWKHEVIYHQDHFIVKPSALSKITPGNEYMVLLEVTSSGSGHSIPATYKFTVAQNTTLEYQQLDNKER